MKFIYLIFTFLLVVFTNCKNNKWDFKTNCKNTCIIEQPTLTQNALYFILNSSNDSLFSINKNTGLLNWKAKINPNSCLYSMDNLILAISTSKIEAFDSVGTKKWTVMSDKIYHVYSHVSNNSCTYASLDSGGINVVKLLVDGNPEFKFKMRNEKNQQFVHLDSSNLFIVTWPDSGYQFSLISKNFLTGCVNWKQNYVNYSLANKYLVDNSNIVISESNHRNRTLLCLKKSTGELQSLPDTSYYIDEEKYLTLKVKANNSTLEINNRINSDRNFKIEIGSFLFDKIIRVKKSIIVICHNDSKLKVIEISTNDRIKTIELDSQVSFLTVDNNSAYFKTSDGTIFSKKWE